MPRWADANPGSSVHHPNHHLRQAREAIPSARTPGTFLSRQEVAEQVNHWIHRNRGSVVELDGNYIGKLERGVIRWPTRRYREALRAVLRVETDAQLGFHGHRRRAGSVDDVDRQQFLRTAAGVLALPWLDLFTPLELAATPHKVGQTEIDQVRATTASLRLWDNTHGGSLGREAAFAHLRGSAQLLQADCAASLRPDLFAAVAYLGGVAGYMAFDAYAHDDARRAFQFSFRCAEQSGSWHLRAHILNMMARQAVWCGRPDDALTYVDLALVRAERLTATERASLHTQRARALAKLGRVQETLAAVGAADVEFSHAKPAEDPDWMDFYNHGQHHADTGQALFDLAVAGHKTQSAPRLGYAIAHHGVPYARSRAMTQIKLATLLMATGDPREAAAIGQHALAAALNLRSQRTIADLDLLNHHAERHATMTEVNDLRGALREVLVN